MSMPIGNAAAHREFLASMAGKAMHHAWLFAGPEGIGKASFAREAALRLLAEAARPGSIPAGGDVPTSDPARALIAAGSHPDYRELVRLPKDAAKPDGDLARGIAIAQVRSLQPMFATAPSMSPRRVVLIDAIDDLERPAANALLKNLEEPPAGTIFLLVSHAPGRLLPTIRSRCRVLRFERLSDAEMRQVLAAGEMDTAEIETLIRAAGGSPARALSFAELELATLEQAMAGIARTGDPTNAQRIKLARALSLKAAQARYDAFLDRAPSFIAAAAEERTGEPLRTALDAYDAARALAVSARALTLDAQATIYEMAGLIARLAGRP